MSWTRLIFFSFVILLNLVRGQIAQRLQIPGATLIENRSAQLRQQRLNAQDFVPKPRRPSPLALPVRPVVEEELENYPPQQALSSSSFSAFDAEVNKLSIPALSSAVRQAEDVEEEPTLRPSPLPFRPERPIALPRERPEVPSARQLPVVRQAQVQSRPVPRPIRPVVRQELDADEEENIPRQPVRQKVRPQPQQPQVLRAAPLRPAPRPQSQYDDDSVPKRRKPVVQILRKYRTDNPDGSITWGFENEDGTFKEETLGIDCTIKGKYGYVDPEGVKREFEYEAGNKCDPNKTELDEDEEEALAAAQPRTPPKKPAGPGKQPQFQYRPQLAPN